MDAPSKAIEQIVKYARGVFAATCILLLFPDDAARQLGLYEVRQSTNGFLWTLLTLAASFVLAPLVADIRHGAVVAWLTGRQERKARRAYRRKRREAVAQSLRSLNAAEQMWIKYCLYHNIRTLTAHCNHPVAQSLYSKGIVEEGSGHILDLPFHIPQEVWYYLLTHKGEFVAESEMQDDALPPMLEDFRKSLRSA